MVVGGWVGQREAILRAVWALKTQAQYAAMDAGSRAREVWGTALRVGVHLEHARRLAGVDQPALLQLMQGAFSSAVAASARLAAQPHDLMPLCHPRQPPATQEVGVCTPSWAVRSAPVYRMCARRRCGVHQ